MARQHALVYFSAQALLKALNLEGVELDSVTYTPERRIVGIYVSTEQNNALNIRGLSPVNEAMELHGPGVIVNDEVERPAIIRYSK